MPIVYQHSINDDVKLAVWEITEPESFFLERVPLKKEVSHPHKRLQHLAGRYLLPALYPDFPLQAILVADTRKPFLKNEQYHFSISHCGNYAAAIVSATKRVGVDIEEITSRIERVQHKFVTPREWDLTLENRDIFAPPYLKKVSPRLRANNPGLGIVNAELLTLLWSAKEAIFKWYGSGQLDFRTHMQLTGPLEINEAGFITMPFTFCKEEAKAPLTLRARFIENFVLSWVVSAPVILPAG